jgi:tyrocidine synthetase III
MEKLDRKNIENVLALTPTQEGMLFHYLKDPEKNHYFEQLCLEVSVGINQDIFEKAWNVVIENNEMLRTFFRWEKINEPVQVALKKYTINMASIDLSGIQDNGAKKRELEKIKDQDRSKKFNLRQVPFRVILCQFSEQHYYIIISNHHILFDGWSTGIILKEFFQAYDKLNRGERLQVSKGKPLFKEFVKFHPGNHRQKQAKFWSNYLAGMDEGTELPIKSIPHDPALTTIKERHVDLEREISDKLEIFLKENRITMATFFYFSWGILLQKYCNSDDVVFGTTVSGRSVPIKGIEDMVGLFINTLPVRVNTGPDDRVLNVLDKVNDFLTRREKYENTPLVDIKETMGLKTGEELFDSLLVIENYPIDRMLKEENSRMPLAVQSLSMRESNNYDLTVSISSFEDTTVQFTYNNEIFTEEIIERMTRHFFHILKDILKNPGQRPCEIDVLSTEEKNKILYDFNRTGEEYPRDESIHRLFEEQVKRTPDCICLSGNTLGEAGAEDSNKQMLQMSYAELNKRSNRLAELLVQKGVREDSIVAIMMERSAEMIIGITGILKAGAAYLPISPDYPPDRIRFMLEDSVSPLLLTSRQFRGTVPFQGDVLALDEDAFLRGDDTSNPHWQSRSGDLVYTIYTSGSTGRPKGVAVRHGGFVNLVNWYVKEFDLGADDKFLLIAPISFDLAQKNLFAPLTAGGCLCLAPPGLLDYRQLCRSVLLEGQTFINCTPMAFYPFVQFSGSDNYKMLKSLRYVCLGGEPIQMDQVLPWLESENCRGELINGYGPTECSGIVSFYRLSYRQDKQLTSVPIGKPIDNIQLYILDKNRNLQPIGVPGEICCAGTGVSWGYLNNPAATYETFIHHPVTPHEPLYRTGDLGRWLEDGNIEFQGRLDQQIKIRGFRIEPGEIESLLLNHKEIKDAVVTAKVNKNGEHYLCAYIVLHSLDSVETSQLREYLREKLPVHMVPPYFVFLKEFPLTVSGKILRSALPEPQINRGDSYRPPSNEREIKLVDIWSHVLAIEKDKIGIDDNFFELGGHSLKATILASNIHKKLNVKLSLAELFQAPTIRELADLINKKNNIGYDLLKAVEAKEYYPLSSMQKRLYILQQMEEEITWYNMPSVVSLEGRIDRESLENIFKKLVMRHESLRTSFEIIDNQPVQRTHKDVEFALEYFTVEHLKEGIGYMSEPEQEIINGFVRPFDFKKAPLFRAGLIKVSDVNHFLMVDMHHISTDGVSENILIKEFMAFYAGETLAPLEVQYKDFSQWQHSRKEKELDSIEAAYWLEEFKGEIPQLVLPYDFKRPAVKSFAGKHKCFEIDSQQLQGLNQLAEAENATLFMILFSVYVVLLSRLSGQDDIIVGTPIAGRRKVELEGILGMFVNTLAIRSFPQQGQEFNQYLGTIREKLLAAYDNQDFPFEDLVDEVLVNRKTDRNPLFETMFILNNMEATELEVPGLKLKIFEYETNITRFDLIFAAVEKEDQLFFTVEYSSKLFKEYTAERIIRYFKNLIESILSDPRQKISDLEMMPVEEKEHILFDFNETENRSSLYETIHELIEAQVQRTPDRICLVGNSLCGLDHKDNKNKDKKEVDKKETNKPLLQLSYRDLNERSNRLAEILIQKGVRQDSIVAIMVERSIEMIIGINGILKAGAAYLPIPPDYPPDRIRYMLEDSVSPLLLTTRQFTGTVPFSGEVLAIDNDAFLRPGDSSDPNWHSRTGDLVYTIYTSGSTGRPKGVVVRHTGFVNLVNWYVKEFGLCANDKFLLIAPISFDLAQKNLFAPLIVGSCLCLAPPGLLDYRQLCRSVLLEGQTVINCAPMAFYPFVEFSASDHYNMLKSLRYVFLGGESIQMEKVLPWLDSELCGAELVNTYGPTECTDVVSYYRLPYPRDKQLTLVPIGKPIDNVRLYILDKNQNLQPVGVPGEICCAGIGVSRGYLNNPIMSHRKFIKDHFAQSGMLYRTGDLGRWLEDGNIEFQGRIDQQVKIRGFRIEPEEIESLLLNHKQLKETVVTAREKQSGEHYLCAYMVLHSPDSIETSQLREYLREKLPEHMVPSYFVFLETFPLTASGKILRSALPEPQINRGHNYRPPINKTEVKLVKIWSHVLVIEKDKIGIDDNFFELGGHSLKATILASNIHKKLDIKISLAELFQTPTIRESAKLINQKTNTGYNPIEAVEAKEYYPLSSMQKRLYILQQMEEKITWYNMPSVVSLEGRLDRARLENTFRKLVIRHESLRTSFEMIENQPVQRIHDDMEFAMEYYTVENLKAGKGDRGEPVQEIIRGFVRPFDLKKAPLFRAGLIKVSLEKHLLIVDMHHITADGTSENILIKEFMAFYAGETLAPLEVQYKDFSRWQNSRKEKELAKKEAAYWLQEFEGEIPQLDLPYDFKRPEIKSFEGKHKYFEISSQQLKGLNQLGEEENATLFMVLFSVYVVLLSRISGQDDIVVGTPIAGRRHAELEGILGMFVNTLAIRSFPHPGQEFTGYLGTIREKLLAAYDKQEYPFEDLVDEVLVNRETDRNPLFDAMFILHNMNASQLEVPGLKLKIFEYETNITRFDLIFAAVEREDQLFFTVEYSSRLFKEESIERFIRYFKNLIQFILSDRQQKLSELEMIPEKEKEHILFDFNGQERDYGINETIHGYFEKQVEKTPGTIALVYNDKHITYKELNERANHLARVLRDKGLKQDTAAALMVERSIEMIIGILAILKAGGAYLPIDTDYPEKRILSILTESDVSFLLTKEKVAKQFSFTSLSIGNKDKINPLVTASRPHIKNFDQLPRPSRTLIDYEKYHQYIGIAMAKHTVSIQTSRGCPFNCAFCHKIWPKNHVVRGAGNLFEEIRSCFNAGVKRFVFIDDIFNLDRDNSARLLEKIIKHDLDIQLFFPNGLRGDILSKDYIDLMVEAGTVNVDLALESASPRVQSFIKKNLKLEKFEENVRYFLEKYPQVLLEMELMIGFPTETEKEALMTLNFIKNLKWVHFPNLNVLKIYPNTDMYRLAVANGVTDEAIESSANLAYHELPETLPFAKSFVKQVQAEFLHEYFLLKERLLHVLPLQMKNLSEDELVQKYDSYLPVEIKGFSDLLKYAKITPEEIGDIQFLEDSSMAAPGFRERMSIPTAAKEKPNNALRILFLDLSQLFSEDNRGMLYDMVEEPLGLMYLMTYIDDKFGNRVSGKIAKSRIDFNSFDELIALVSDFKPDLLGIRTLSYYKEFFHRTVAILRQWGLKVPVIAGGPYATSDYMTMLQDPKVDIAVLGEGELTAAELIEKMIENGNTLPHQQILKEIQGIAYIKEADKVGLKERNREIILLDQPYPIVDFQSGENLQNINQPHDLLYLIATSGSTGKPKCVMLEHRNLINLLNFEFSQTGIDFSGNILQFASIGFDVSAQEIFSSLLSGGTLYLINKDLKGDIFQLYDFIGKNKIGVAFLPPAFLKFVFSQGDFAQKFPVIIGHIIAAGEQLMVGENFRRHLIDHQVLLHNHYGPSETHVVTTLTIDPAGNIPERPSIGKPIPNTNIYILDNQKKIQPIGVKGEMYIAGDNVGRGYYKSEKLTAEKFILNPFDNITRSYRTGDIARWLPDGNIEFLGRKDFQVKIRGFRVELGDIEAQMLKHKDVKDAVVLVKEDETGDNYLTAYFVPAGKNTGGVDPIKESLSAVLPEYMVPPYFVPLPEMPVTPNGKLDKKALTGIEFQGEKRNYTAPADAVEEEVTAIWCEILGIEKYSLSSDANFFESGGHSLKATVILSKIHKKFNIKMTLSDIFKEPTISGIAHYIKGARENRFSGIAQAPENNYYHLSSAQKRLYFLQQMEEHSTGYNMTAAMEIEGNLELEALTGTFRKLIARHEIFRTSFQIIDREPCQKVYDDVTFEIEYHQSVETGDRDMEKMMADFIRPFDLSQAPLLRASLIKELENKHILLMDMHHIVYDALSHNIFLMDFFKFYRGDTLPPLELAYKDFSYWQNLKDQQQEIKKQETYWLKVFSSEPPVLNIPIDFPRPLVYRFEGDKFYFKVDDALTSKLKQLVVETGVTLNILLLAAYNLMLFKYTNQEDIIVGTPVSGRKHHDLHAIIGFFANMLPMRTRMDNKQSFRDLLEIVKVNFLDAYENQDYPFDELVWKLKVKRNPGRHPLVETVLVVVEDNAEREQTMAGLEKQGLKITPINFKEAVSHFDLMVYVVEKHGAIDALIEYRAELFKHSTIEGVARNFNHILEQLVENSQIKLEEITITQNILVAKTNLHLDDQEDWVLE